MPPLKFEVENDVAVRALPSTGLKFLTTNSHE